MTNESADDDEVEATSESSPPKEGPPQSGTSESPSIGQGLPYREILELDHIYEALGHPRRRYLCYTLLEDTQWTVTELATKIAAWENEIPVQEVTDHQRERVYVSLVHAHIPKLADDDILTFDDVAELISPAENTDQVLAALEGMGATLDSQQETHARDDIDDGDQ